MNSIKKLKVGIIVDDINQPYLVYDLYQKSLESNYYSIEYLVIQKTNNLKNKNLLNKLIDFLKSKGLFRLIDRIIFEFIDQIETQIFIFKNISGTHSFSYNSGVLVNDFTTHESI